MKKIFSIIACAALLGGIMTSCEKSPIDPLEGKYSVNVENAGTLKSIGQEKSGSLYEFSISCVNVDGASLETVLLSNQYALPAGTYLAAGETPAKNNWLPARTTVKAGGKEISVVSGEITISKDGDNYSLVAVLQDVDGKYYRFTGSGEIVYEKQVENNFYEVTSKAVAGGLYMFNILMCGTDITPERNEKGEWAFPGAGQYYQVTLFSANPELPAGTYSAQDVTADLDATYSIVPGGAVDGTFAKGIEYMLLGIIPYPVYTYVADVADDGSTALGSYITDGTVKVERDDDGHYTLTIDSSAAKVTYEGEIPACSDVPLPVEVPVTTFSHAYEVKSTDLGDGTFQIDLALATEGITATQAEDGSWSFSGDGQILNATIFSSVYNLGVGLYTAADAGVDLDMTTFAVGPTGYVANTFAKGFEYMLFGSIPTPVYTRLYDVKAGAATLNTYLTDGTITIGKSGSKYSFRYENASMAAEYSGKLGFPEQGGDDKKVTALASVYEAKSTDLGSGVYQVELSLATEGVSASRDAEGNWTFAGNGQTVNLTFFSSASDLATGTYPAGDCGFDETAFTSKDYTVGTFAKGYELQLWGGLLKTPAYSRVQSVADGVATLDQYLEEGSISVEKDGDEYVISLDCGDFAAKYEGAIAFPEAPIALVTVYEAKSTELGDGSYRIDLSLCTEGVTATLPEDSTDWTFAGNGKVVNLTFISSAADLATGDYAAGDCGVDDTTFGPKDYTVGTFAKGFEYMLFGVIPLPVYSRVYDIADGVATLNTYLTTGTISAGNWGGGTYSLNINSDVTATFMGTVTF